MKAIICAAGEGKRLRPLTDDKPKSLVKIGEKSILEYMLDNIFKCDFKKVVIIVGHYAEKVKEYMRNEYKGCNIKYYTNQDYKKTDNMFSLWMAKDEIDDGFIFLNSDILFDIEILRKLINENHPNVAVIDDRIKLDEHSMKLKIADNKLKTIGRHLKYGNARAIGMYKFSPEGAKKYFEEIRKLIYSGMSNLQIEQPLQLFLKHSDMHVVSTGSLLWQEIDNNEDLQNAEKKLKEILKQKND